MLNVHAKKKQLLTGDHLAVLLGNDRGVRLGGGRVSFLALPAALEDELFKVSICQGYGRNFKVQILRDCQQV